MSYTTHDDIERAVVAATVTRDIDTLQSIADSKKSAITDYDSKVVSYMAESMLLLKKGNSPWNLMRQSATTLRDVATASDEHPDEKEKAASLLAYLDGKVKLDPVKLNGFGTHCTCSVHQDVLDASAEVDARLAEVIRAIKILEADPTQAVSKAGDSKSKSG